MESDEIRRAVAAAGFIFRGRINHHWTGEAPTMPAAASEAVPVRIEQVLRSTPVLRGLAGQDALVLTAHAARLRQLHGPILFTDCISLGQQLLLRDLGHVEASDDSSRQVAELIREADERPLRERIAAADLIVRGEVTDSKMTESARPPKSEHDPLWWIARVAVRAAVKGRRPTGPIDVLFASSTDMAWFKSPKLHPGTSGIFLLHRMKDDEAPKEVPRSAYQVTDPLDLLPIERLAEVERVLGTDRGER